ncbi:MAG: SDR family NAD(P)-dependent oxidoreductase [Gracilimonas sp.]|nr:SDR family NAD(P)-dependent oxidoreductase [Gracilimonas sp.]
MALFDDKVVLVTGGADGIGKVTATKFLQEGASVEIWDVNEKAAKEALKDWESNGYTVRFQKVNVADHEAVETAMSDLKTHFGKLDVLINNAGITRDGTLLKMDHDKWQSVIDVNLTGVFNCGKAAAAVMAENGSGVILNASSVVAHNGNFGQSNYVAAKSGLIGMSQTWAKELGRKGIRVNVVAPGFINTSMVETVPDKVLDQLKGNTPLAVWVNRKTLPKPICF